MKLIQNWLKNESKLSFLGWPHQNVYCWPNFKTPSLITIVLKFREIFPKLKVRIDLENIWHLEGNVTSISSLLLWTLSLLRLFNATLKQLTLNRWSITNFPWNWFICHKTSGHFRENSRFQICQFDKTLPLFIIHSKPCVQVSQILGCEHKVYLNQIKICNNDEEFFPSDYVHHDRLKKSGKVLDRLPLLKQFATQALKVQKFK